MKIGNILLTILIVTIIMMFFGILFEANSQEIPPHVVKGYLQTEDNDYWYNLQTLSDGTEKVHKVRKPAPPNPCISRSLIATNDLPVQVQYVYRDLYADMTVRTNTVRRTKTAKERIAITLPPLPEYIPPVRSRTDAIGQAIKRSREERTLDRIRTGPVTSRRELPDRFIFVFENGETKVHLKQDMSPSFLARARAAIAKPSNATVIKTMSPSDPVINRKVIDGKLHNTHRSGKVSVTDLNRVHTAKVKSAPLKKTTK